MGENRAKSERERNRETEIEGEKERKKERQRKQEGEKRIEEKIGSPVITKRPAPIVVDNPYASTSMLSFMGVLKRKHRRD